MDFEAFIHEICSKTDQKPPSAEQLRRLHKSVFSDKSKQEEGELDDAHKVMQLLDDGAQLFRQRQKLHEGRQRAWNELPLFQSGRTYTDAEACDGFRVRDGYLIEHQVEGHGVRIGSELAQGARPDKIHAFVTRWPRGMSWVYWSHSFRAPCGKDLGECMLEYGLGGWKDEKRDIQAKVVFLSPDRVKEKSFTLAICRLSSPTTHVFVRGQERDEAVYRVYRSCVPDHVQKAIGLRQLASLVEKPIPPTFWSWSPEDD